MKRLLLLHDWYRLSLKLLRDDLPSCCLLLLRRHLAQLLLLRGHLGGSCFLSLYLRRPRRLHALDWLRLLLLCTHWLWLLRCNLRGCHFLPPDLRRPRGLHPLHWLWLRRHSTSFQLLLLALRGPYKLHRRRPCWRLRLRTDLLRWSRLQILPILRVRTLTRRRAIFAIRAVMLVAIGRLILLLLVVRPSPGSRNTLPPLHQRGRRPGINRPPIERVHPGGKSTRDDGP